MSRRRAGTSIRKASGEPEAYSSRKLYRSLRACGADKALAQRVLEAVERKSRADMTTGELEDLTAKILTEESRPLAARYLLKRALFDLGPTGYPFENFVAELLEAQGYRTEIGVMLEGKCVRHEIDVVATRPRERDLIECKFRTGAGSRCDVKVALYVHARALDLRARVHGSAFDRFRLITNAKFTGDAVRYSECVGLDLLGWNYPRTQTLPALIEQLRLHPLTCLTSLTRAQKAVLLARGVVLCRDLGANCGHLNALDLDRGTRDVVAAEVEALLA